MKRVFVLVCSVILSLAWVAPAQAATKPAWAKPTAPTAVTAVAGATPDKVLLGWSAPSDAGSKKTYGYSIVKEGNGVRSVYWQKADRDVAKAYSRTFTAVGNGGTTFTVKAWSLAGSSPAATASYAAPAPTPSGATVYSFDTATKSLIAVPAAGGTPKVVVAGADVSGLTADGAGNVFFADRTAGTVVTVATATGVVRTLATGLTTTRAVEVDAAGNVYFADGAEAHKVTPAGVSSVLYTAPQDIYDLVVTPAGQVVLDHGAFESTDVTLVTITPAGVASSRNLECSTYGYCSELKIDSRGVLWVEIFATGGSGYSEWYRVPVGADAPTDLLKTRLGYYSVGLDSADTFYVAATKTFCPGPSQGGPNPCTPDLSSTEILRITAQGGFNSTLAVTGLTLVPGSIGIDVDGAGSIYVVAAEGLLKYAKTGGAPTVLATGSFTEVVVVG